MGPIFLKKRFLKSLFIYLKSRVTKAEAETEKSSICSFTLQMAATAGVGPI